MDTVPAYAPPPGPPLAHLHAPPTEHHPEQIHSLPDLPPSYAPIDPLQTTFTILGSFVHTSSGPAYQLSRALDQRHYNLFLRRLNPKEQRTLRTGSTPLAFDRTSVLYEIIAGSSLVNDEPVIKGHRKSCLPGTLYLKNSGRATWIERSERANDKPKSVLKVGGGGLGARRVLKKRGEGEASEWMTMDGKVVAKEVLRDAADGGVVPVLEVDTEVDAVWREVILVCWIARLWAAFAAEKTKWEALGGRGKRKFLSVGNGWGMFKK